MEFVDAKGRRWHPRLTLGALRDLETLTGIPVLDAVADPERATEQVFRNARVVSLGLWLSVMNEAEAARVSQEDFEDSIVGPVVSDAMTAFIETLCECFPMAEVRNGDTRPPTLSRGRGKRFTAWRRLRAWLTFGLLR